MLFFFIIGGKLNFIHTYFGTIKRFLRYLFISDEQSGVRYRWCVEKHNRKSELRQKFLLTLNDVMVAIVISLVAFDQLNCVLLVMRIFLTIRQKKVIEE